MNTKAMARPSLLVVGGLTLRRQIGKDRAYVDNVALCLYVLSSPFAGRVGSSRTRDAADSSQRANYVVARRNSAEESAMAAAVILACSILHISGRVHEHNPERVKQMGIGL
jgi:hypothetical protein